ncbi:MAG: glycosyltransferase family 4 protein [Acidimicrobiia bacterium]|nr:glycosyltransferase family 4 protein [Acidimicrobiia bacterium]
MSGRSVADRAELAVVKPDFGARGGFERHLDGLVAGLRGRDWRVTVVEIDGWTRPSRLYGLPVEPVQLEFHDEYFLHLAMVERVQQLRLDRFDVVLTTQPPTYLAPHPRKVALFYHHPRQFYDLAEPFMASGFADPDLHRAAARAVRALERPAVGDVRFWLAGSAEVAGRLDRYWAIPAQRIDIHRAPPTTVPDAAPFHRPDGPVLCVGRQEWPKRSELLVQAMHLAKTDRPAHLVGGGSRLDFVRSVDAQLHHDPATAASLDDEQLWLNRGIYAAGWEPFDGPPSGRIVFEGDVDDERRDELYDEAAVVVAPAYCEDYGLTAIEAMVRARPVVVCRDGGGLTELVDDGITGVVVEPDARALASAVDHLLRDPARAARLGESGRRAVLDITMEQAVDQVDAILRAVLEQPIEPSYP